MNIRYLITLSLASSISLSSLNGNEAPALPPLIKGKLYRICSTDKEIAGKVKILDLGPGAWCYVRYLKTINSKEELWEKCWLNIGKIEAIFEVFERE